MRRPPIAPSEFHVNMMLFVLLLTVKSVTHTQYTTTLNRSDLLGDLTVVNIYKAAGKKNSFTFMVKTGGLADEGRLFCQQSPAVRNYA